MRKPKPPRPIPLSPEMRAIYDDVQRNCPCCGRFLPKQPIREEARHVRVFRCPSCKTNSKHTS